jgi:hypothetical protein
MRPCWLRELLIFVLLYSLSFPSLAADAPSVSAAILNASGKVQVNGGTVPRGTALLSGDRIQTQSDSVANITATGSSVMVMPNSLLEFQGDAVQLIQGGVVIATSNGMLAKAYGWTVNPGTQKGSKFEVAENEGSVIFAAQQGSVTLSDGKETSTVSEGQHTTKKKKRGGATAAGTSSGPPVKTIAIVTGAAGAVAAAGIVLANSGSGSKCVSPSGGKKCCTNQQGNNNCQSAVQ